MFRVDYCGGYTYFGQEQETCFSEDYFAGEEWRVRLVMEGEDRLIHNRNVQIERYECSFGADSAELGDTTVPAFSVQKDLLVREALEQAFAMMTKRQKEVVRYYYIEGLTGKEIAKLYGISQQAVALTLFDVKKKLQKNRKKFFKVPCKSLLCCGLGEGIQFLTFNETEDTGCPEEFQKKGTNILSAWKGGRSAR